jgi:L-ascorbate metabolism protein UlaG (beta-lactamase superfamily)
MRPVRELGPERRRALRVALRDGGDEIHPVERGQVVEVHDVVVRGVRAHHEIADVLRVERHLEAEGVFDRTH